MEVLVTCSVFIMVISAVYAVYAKGLGYSRTLGGEISSFRLPAIAFDKIYRELLCDAEDIRIPEPSYSFEEKIISNDIVFATSGDEVTSSKIAGYFFDPEKLNITRYEFSNDVSRYADKEELMKHIEKAQVIANNIKNMEYMRYENLVYISITAGTEEKPYLFTTSVYIR